MDLAQLVALPVLSIRQPWASYIVSGIKTIELRNWSTDYRGWLWIHTGKHLDIKALEIYELSADDFQTGGLLGIAKLGSCMLIRSAAEWQARRNEHRSPGTFAEGVYAWLIQDTVALYRKIECRGELRLFSLDAPTRKRVEQYLIDSPFHQDFIDTIRELPDPPQSPEVQ